MPNTIERSVRRALEKGDAGDPNFRLLVYEAAERAINRTEADGKVDTLEGDRQRKDLIAAVESIEADYPASREPDANPGMQETEPDAGPTVAEDGARKPVATPADDAGGPDRGGEALVAHDKETTPHADSIAAKSPRPSTARDRRDDADAGRTVGEAGETWSPGGGGRVRAPGSRLSRRLVTLVIVVLVGFLLVVAAYLVIPFLLPGGLEEVSQTDPIANAIESSGAPVAGEDGWVTAFSGTDLASLAERSREGAEVVTASGGRSAIRVGTGSDALPYAFVLPAAALSAFPAGPVRGELTVGSPDGQTREFTVECVLGTDSLCGRQRFSTSRTQEVFVFELTLPQARDTAGELLVDPQIGEGAADLDVYGFRLKGP